MLVLRPGTRTRCVAYSPDGRTLATGGADGMLWLWDLATGTARHTIAASDYPVLRVAWNLDGSLILATDFTGRIRAWSTQYGTIFRQLEGATARTILEWIERPVTADDANWSLAEVTIIFDRYPVERSKESTDRMQLVDATGWSLSLATPRHIYQRNYPEHLNVSRATAFTRYHDQRCYPHDPGPESLGRRWPRDSGHWFAPATASGVLLGTYLPGSGITASNPMHHDLNIALAPGEMVLAELGAPQIKLWNLADQQPERPRDTLLSRLGESIRRATGRSEPTQPSSAADGQRIVVLDGHTGRVRALAFHPDGRTLLSGGHDGLVCLWDVGEGGSGEPRRFDWEIGLIDAVAFSPDGATAAAGGRKGVVVWDVGEDRWA